MESTQEHLNKIDDDSKFREFHKKTPPRGTELRWLATSARKLKVFGSSPAARYVEGSSLQ